MFYVYVLYSEKGRFYIGYSSDLKKRMHDHTAKRVASTKNAKYRLVYYEAYCNKMDAVMREKFLKSGSGHKYLIKQLHHFLTEDAESHHNNAGVV